MKKILLSLLLMSAFISCDRVVCREDIPSCIEKWIEKVRSEQRWNPPAEVHEYIYNGKIVYLLSSDCCDQYYTLVDGSCNYICAPSGGIAGKGDNKCEGFYKNARHVRLVWKDDR
jgi:hypothetical protein